MIPKKNPMYREMFQAEPGWAHNLQVQEHGRLGPLPQVSFCPDTEASPRRGLALREKKEKHCELEPETKPGDGTHSVSKHST